jgi:hypothetical protein
MRKTLAFAIALSLLGSTAFAAGEVYRWKDANGIWHFSDQPQPGAELVRANRPATPAPTAVATPPASTALPVSNEVAQQVRQEAAAAKTKLCEKAKLDYDQKIQAQRLHTLDDKGNKVYLNSAEIDAARLQARSARDVACGP